VHKAAAIVLFHNHPSGEPEPSAEDLALRRRLVACGQLLGIEVLDHIVVGDATDRWVSLRDRGML
jgi:DNA repair protein RadC